jgi:hypothetical protein
VARTELEAARAEVCSAQSELKKLEARLSFSPKLPTSVLLSILAMGQLGRKAGERAACVKREWRDVVGTAKALGCTGPRSSAPQVVLTQQSGRRRGSSSPLGGEAVGSWVTEGSSMSLYRGWSRRWQKRR